MKGKRLCEILSFCCWYSNIIYRCHCSTAAANTTNVAHVIETVAVVNDDDDYARIGGNFKILFHG